MYHVRVTRLVVRQTETGVGVEDTHPALTAISHTYTHTHKHITIITSGYATWFTAGGAIRITHYDVSDDVITRKL